MLDLDLKEIVHELGDVAWCEGKNFEDWVEPRVNAILQALDERDALKAEVQNWRELKNLFDQTSNDNAHLRHQVAALDAELEKAKAKASKAQELADWHLSHRTLAESQLEAARNQEPFCWIWQHSNGCTAGGTFGSEHAANDFWDIISPNGKAIPLYASPAPAQQSAEAIGWEEEAKSAFWHGWMLASGEKCDGHAEFLSYIDKRKSELKGGENER